MRYRKLGKWGIKVSELSLGSYLTVGMTNTEEESRDTIRWAFDHGINLFDTANAYNGGEAERVFGRYLKDYPRDQLVVLTKVYAPMGPGPNQRGLSAKHIREQCEASLKRLGMDYVDIYMCHRPDPETPLEETIGAMDDLARRGLILYWAFSEWPATLVVRANLLARQLGLRPAAVSEPRYSLLYRYPEKLLFPTTQEEGIGNVVFSPVAHGMLTGKYKPGEDAPAGTRAADPKQNSVIKSMYWTEENKSKSQELVALARHLGFTAVQVALAWILRRPEVSSVILGARRTEQLEENVGALDVTLDQATLTRLDELFPLPQTLPPG